MTKEEQEIQMISERLDAVRESMYLIDGTGIKCPKCNLYMNFDLDGICSGPECCPEMTGQYTKRDIERATERAQTIPEDVFKSLVAMRAALVKQYAPEWYGENPY